MSYEFHNNQAGQSDDGDGNIENILSQNGYPSPFCGMCPKKRSATSRCLTCKHLLCEHCDFNHKVMVFFKHHKVVSLDAPETEDNEIEVTIYDPEVDFLNGVKDNVVKGYQNVNYLGRLAHELEISLKNLERERFASIEEINTTCRKYQDMLIKQRDEVISTLEIHFNNKQECLMVKRDQINAFIRDFYLKLSNMELITGDVGEEAASGIDLGFLNGFTSENHFPYFESSNKPTWTVPSFQQSNRAGGSELNLDSLYESLTLPTSALPDNRQQKFISVNSSQSLTNSEVDFYNTNFVNSMQIYKTIGKKGAGSGHFSTPHGFCLGFNGDIVVADSNNHRIQVLDRYGNFKQQFGRAGRHDGQLWHPRKIALLPIQRCYVVCDRGYERSRMQIFTEDGEFSKKIPIQYIDIVAGIAITTNEDIVLVDSVTPTIFIIGQNGYLRSIDCTNFMEEPSDIAVRDNEFYVCDFKGHCIVVVNEEGQLLRKFGCKTTTNFPNGIDLASNGDVLIGDSHGNFLHICVYSKFGDFIAEFRCNLVKVSRCCGLKITSEGRLITVDKNYNIVLILDALFLPQDQF